MTAADIRVAHVTRLEVVETTGTPDGRRFKCVCSCGKEGPLKTTNAAGGWGRRHVSQLVSNARRQEVAS